MSSQAPNRRSFLQLSGAFLALPAATYKSALGADQPPSEKLRLASIGVGNQGSGNLKRFLKDVVAVCDVDKNFLAAGAATLEKAGKKPQTYTDFRKVIDAKDFDAVIVTVPDHWHALITVMACQAGKDVFCEKPLSLTIAEGRKMVEAARKNKRVVQTGSMQRSAKEFHQACELVRNGALGTLTSIKVGLPGPNWIERAKRPVPDSVPPAVLDYDLWLGPAPERPYNKNRVHYLFRFFWDYSGGQMTNWGAHHLDIAQWALGMDDSGPTKVEATATFNKDRWFETPETATVKYTYANGLEMHCGQGKGAPAGGTTFVGEKGSIHVNRGKIEIKPAELSKQPCPSKLEISNNHYKNFLDCIKTRNKPICDVEVGHRSATVCHLGNIAIRSGKRLTWDPVKEQFVGDADANKWVSKEYRKPWSLG
ncbi:MAG TPA: Gfo/Idh/MocA family oxidoreductase [Fimbriiglobus sp.]|jgi:predicted dehydrogenase